MARCLVRGVKGKATLDRHRAGDLRSLSLDASLHGLRPVRTAKR